MPFMYPEQLRELRAQYPNTQFDGHGRVVGGMPLNQYNVQPANPAAIPASVRTYSQFDPATGTWVRHTNGAASVQSPAPASTPSSTPVSAPAQGTPINFQQVLGYTPAGFEGATLNVGGRANAQPTQAMRPLPRQTARQNTQPSIIPVVTQQSTERPVQITEVPEDVPLWGNQGKLPDGTPVVVNLPKDPNFGAGIAVHQPLLNTPVANPTTGTQVALTRHYGQKTTPNLPGFINTKPNRVVTFGEHMAKLGNGFLGLLNLGRPTNLDPDLSNHSDPRW